MNQLASWRATAAKPPLRNCWKVHSAWDPQSSGLSSLKGNAKPGGGRLTPDGFAVVPLQLASWLLL